MSRRKQRQAAVREGLRMRRFWCGKSLAYKERWVMRMLCMLRGLE